MIRIVDSLMGSGKTTYFIRHMKEHPEQKYIYVTPYIAECERIQQACPELDFRQPERVGALPKMASFLQLIRERQNIATTHELFRNIDDTSGLRRNLLGYILIMDEVLETVGTIREIGRTDINMLLQKNLIEKADNDLVIWRSNSAETERFRDVRTISRRNSLYLLAENTRFMWLFPVEIFAVFQEVYILTYMFYASHMRCMLDMHRISYDIFHIDNWELREGREDTDKTELRRKIIVYDRLNELGEAPKSLSKTWYDKNVRNGKVRKLHNNRVGYIQRICEGGVDAAMWTCFKEYQSVNTRQNTAFCPCNARAQNTYASRRNLAFLINVYDIPIIKNFFIQHSVIPDEDAFALSQLLQWIWRSAIRNGETINLYLPSSRMRGLLGTWE